MAGEEYILGLITGIVSSVWVYRDARSKGVSGPTGWAVFCFLAWIIALPLYMLWGRKRVATPAQPQPPPPRQHAPPPPRYAPPPPQYEAPPPQMPQPQAQARPRFCPQCGASAPAGDRFCPTCGASLPMQPGACPRCENPVPSGSRFCPNCAHEMQ